MLKDWEQILIKILKIRFHSVEIPTERCFILPDGDFLTTDWDTNSGKGYEPHYTIDNFIGNFIYRYLHKSFDEFEWYSDTDKEWARKHYHITDDDVNLLYNNIDFSLVGHGCGCKVLENIGCVRLNAYAENYIIIPNPRFVKSLTTEVYNSLELWLDKFFINSNIKHNKNLTIEDNIAWDCVEIFKYNSVDEIIKIIKRYYTTKNLENIYIYEKYNTKSKKQLNEVKRQEIVNKSKTGLNYKNKNINRWVTKNKCSVLTQVKDYNQIDMNTFWKEDLLKFGVPIQGQTSNYIVTVEFKGILNRIKDKVQNNNATLTKNIIYTSLFEALNSNDVKINCSCADFKYRFAYQATRNGYKSGELENRESNITNPNNNLGAACKHILAVLNNVEWLQKIASVINNYIAYCKDNMEYNYSRFIFPKIYGVSYNTAVQMCMNDYDANGNINDKLLSDESLINLSNALGAVRGRIKKGSNKNPIKINKK